MSRFIELIRSDQADVRNQAMESLADAMTQAELLAEAQALDHDRRNEENLYLRVRELFFLASLYRYHLPRRLPQKQKGQIPFDGYEHLLQRRFAEAIDAFLRIQVAEGPSDAICSALAEAYHRLAFQTLADQVRRSVRAFRGNQWMFRIGHPADHPLRLRRELTHIDPHHGNFPVLCEKTAVRMDFTHSAWSDIFFLGMDYPEGAKVLNVSVNLGVRGRDVAPRPPIESYLRVIDQPILRLVSIDLGASTEIHTIGEVFDFARDYLGLLKAAVIAAGIVPAGLEGCRQPISDVLEIVVGAGRGLELVSKVNDIPKGSRLAVSTNLLGSLISLLMRATHQVEALTGPLAENDRRTVAARAILGEWLGGSGGGWQDSGGIWPGIKLIEGTIATEPDPEHGISRGRLMPVHQVFDQQQISAGTRQKLQDSLVMVHGGMAQNVGPILEMVTEHYLLRSALPWNARQQAIGVLDRIIDALKRGDVQAVGKATTENFEGPLQAIIPWATNHFTDQLIGKCRERYGDRFWGFWMLGGMAGGGMGFIFDPAVKPEAQDWLRETMVTTKRQLQSALPFAMDPVVYDFAINDRGTVSELLVDEAARMPDRYYAMMLPGWLRSDPLRLSSATRAELVRMGERCRGRSEEDNLSQMLLDGLLPRNLQGDKRGESLAEQLVAQGFDPEQHEQIRAEMRAGRIGLAQNRLAPSTTLEDVRDDVVIDTREGIDIQYQQLGTDALRAGQVAVVTLAAGVGSRWTQGAGVSKALHPFCKFAGRHRSFLEVHLAKNRYLAHQYDATIPHVFTTGYLTDAPIREHLRQKDNYGFGPDLYVSSGRSVGLRMIPMVRDLRYAWEEMPQQMLDQQQQKVRDSLRAALMDWARHAGEGADYTDNMPMQCLHPVGHWYEVPNLLRNGTLVQLLERQPRLTTLLLHNIDTLGANVDPGLLGLHLNSKKALSFEVISRRLEDRGGGLARVNGRPRLVEGLAMPNDEDEFKLTYYNSMTTWIDIDQLLTVFGLDRQSLRDATAVERGIRRLAQRMPTYLTLKDVKKRWGHGQEDIFPVAQFEKLWGDMTSLTDVSVQYFVTPLHRGQQLKHPAQLDPWARDGSAAFVDSLCRW